MVDHKITSCIVEEYAERQALYNEIHSRPFLTLDTPSRCTHIAVFDGENGGQGDYEHLCKLCAHYNLPIPQATSKHQIIDFGSFRLKWERHTEFCTYTFIREGLGKNAFQDTAISVVPQDWLKSIPGELLVGLHVLIEERPGDGIYSAAELKDIFGNNTVVAASGARENATAWTDFHIYGDGFGRLLVGNINMLSDQTGRFVQRLLEIETYRMMAMLAFPLCKWVGAETVAIEQELSDNVQLMTEVSSPEDEKELLKKLTDMAAKIEHVSAMTSYRFNATTAYNQLVERRIDNLKEKPIDGYQRFSSFMNRRFAPAMRTCASMQDRIANLSRRINRASTLLQTRIDTTMQSQNSQLLESMARRARIQLRMQQTVEGLSVVAMSYYGVGLISYLAKAAYKVWPFIDPAIATGIATPFVLLLAFLGIRKIRKMIGHE